MASTGDDQWREQELRNARNEKSGLERLMEQKQNICRENQNKIARLKAVKSNLETQKANAKRNHKSLKEYAQSAEEFSEWIGKTRDKTVGKFEDSIIPQYASYVERIDEILDAVCDEITRLQNDNLQLNGDIFGIASAINSLINKIRTLCN